MFKNLFTKLAVILLIICFSTVLLAQEEEETEVEEVVITATRTPTELDKVGGSSVEVVTNEDIEAKKQTQVKELLNELPGIDLVSNGGPGTSTSIFIRGSDNKSVLVLIDGIMYNNPSSANRDSNLGNLTLDNIERIEVIKGSQSVLYGSNATAGVVNIITKKGKGEPVVFGGMEAGSYETFKYNAGTRGSSGDFNYSFSATQTSVGGFSTANDRNDDIPHDGNTDEKDNWNNQTISAVLGYDVTENFDITFSLRRMMSTLYYDDWANGYAGDRFDYDSATSSYIANPDGDTDRHQDQEQLYYGLKLHNILMDKTLESTISYNVGSDFRELYDQDNDKSSSYLGKSAEMTWQVTAYIGEIQELTIGVGMFTEEMEQERFSSSTSSTVVDEKATTNSNWLQDKIMLLDEDLIIMAGVRNDRHEKFGDASTYRIAPSYQIGDTGLKLKASTGTGFQAPSLFNLYSSYGNEDLEAEKSRTTDYGFEYTIGKKEYILGLTFFSSEFENQIDYDMATSKYANADGKTKTSGYESFVTANMDRDTKITLSKVYTKTEDSDGNSIVRRPEDKISLTARTKLWDKLRPSISILNVGKREAYAGAKDKDGNSVDELDAYTLVNLAASYQFNDYFELYAKINNTTDAYYEECWSYATPGRSYYAGVKVKY